MVTGRDNKNVCWASASACVCVLSFPGEKHSESMLSEYLNVCSSYDLLQPIPGGSAYILLPLCAVGGGGGG